MKKFNYIKNNERSTAEEPVDRTPAYAKHGIEPIKSAIAPTNKMHEHPVKTLRPDPIQNIVGKTDNGQEVFHSIPNLNAETYSTMDNLHTENFNGKVTLSSDAQNELKEESPTILLDDVPNTEDLSNILYEMEPDTYLLLVSGVPVCSAPLDEVEEEVNAIIFGTHDICDGVDIDADQIVVVKKVNIKVGVTLV